MATSIADRYLVNLAVTNTPPPCLILLTVVSTLVAAKLEQPLQPSFKRMLRLVDKSWQLTLDLKEALKLEN